MNLKSAANFEALATMTSDDIYTKESNRRMSLFNNANWDVNWLINARDKVAIDKRCREVWEACRKPLTVFEHAANGVVWKRREQVASGTLSNPRRRRDATGLLRRSSNSTGWVPTTTEKVSTCGMGPITHAHFFQMSSRSVKEVSNAAPKDPLTERPWGYAFNERYLEGLRFEAENECTSMHYDCMNIVYGYADIQRRAMFGDATAVQNSTESLWYLEEGAHDFVKTETLKNCFEKANKLFVKNGLPAIDIQLRD